MDDLISRKQAIDALRKMQTYKLFSGDDMLLIDQAGAMTELMLLPSAEPQITYQYCAKALMKLWDDDVIMFCEYDRIMDRLKKRMEVDNDRK